MDSAKSAMVLSNPSSASGQKSGYSAYNIIDESNYQTCKLHYLFFGRQFCSGARCGWFWENILIFGIKLLKSLKLAPENAMTPLQSMGVTKITICIGMLILISLYMKTCSPGFPKTMQCHNILAWFSAISKNTWYTHCMKP